MGTETIAYVARVTQEGALAEFALHTAPYAAVHGGHYVLIGLVAVWAKVRGKAKKVEQQAP